MSGGALHITELYAWVMVDPRDGTEGVPSFADRAGNALPMYASNRRTADMMRDLAEELARSRNTKVTLCHFAVRVDVDVIDRRPAEQREH